MPFHTHNHAQTMRRRFTVLFVGSFVVFFALLNTRYLYANVKYWMSPGTISSKTTVTPPPFPLATAVQYQPLPNQAQLVIDSIGVNAPVVFGIPGIEDQIYEGLEQGVVHYADTVKPGTQGLSILLGHSSAYPWYKGDYGSVFALLGKMKVGDRFYVRYSDGRFFIFQVSESIVFNPLSDDKRLAELEQSAGTSLILVSCYPVGTNYQRIAIKADVVGQ